MKRWNGWGDETVDYRLPPEAAEYLETQLGPGTAVPDAQLKDVLSQIPASRLPAVPELDLSAETRLRHARGQSLPDWVALRSGKIGAFPDAVAFPRSAEDLRQLLRQAQAWRAVLIPYGGGTSVVGHINPSPAGPPAISVDLGRLHRLLDLDEVSHLATFGAGASGPQIEAELNRRGFTLGHFPQSFEQSTLGGWIATRSTGQQSIYYGRIESLFAGGHVETPGGPLDLPPHPASAAGPDLRQLLLGSEGRLGIITEAMMRIRRLPQNEVFLAAFFAKWESAVATTREMIRSGIPLSMLRLSDALETQTTLALSGRPGLVRAAARGLDLLGMGRHPCLLIYALTGDRSQVEQSRRRLQRIARRDGGLPVGPLIGKLWRKSRFSAPYLRNTLWERGYALDTVETALPWSAILAAAADLGHVLSRGLEAQQERVLVFSHLSHLYHSGASLYTTLIFRRGSSPEETLERWQGLKRAASETIVAHRGTISHQHGVGRDHAAYLHAEKGMRGMQALQAVIEHFDPEALLNPGILLDKGVR